MADNFQPQGSGMNVSRRTLRLTFRIANGEAQLLSSERLDMICPPSIGERPEAGKHGGFWMELRDGSDQMLFHRLLPSTLVGSVEVHSPDGKIQREFGAVPETIFEVLLPDNAEARSIVLMGEYLDPAQSQQERKPGANELARFDVLKKEQDDQ